MTRQGVASLTHHCISVRFTCLTPTDYSSTASRDVRRQIDDDLFGFVHHENASGAREGVGIYMQAFNMMAVENLIVPGQELAPFIGSVRDCANNPESFTKPVCR